MCVRNGILYDFAITYSTMSTIVLMASVLYRCHALERCPDLHDSTCSCLRLCLAIYLQMCKYGGRLGIGVTE